MSLEKAVAALRAGELVVFPTETVYGLGADATKAKLTAALNRVAGEAKAEVGEECSSAWFCSVMNACPLKHEGAHYSDNLPRVKP